MTRNAPAAVDPGPEPEKRRRTAQRGRPKILDHDRIIAAALDMLTDQGLASFTLHKLALRLNVSVMTLYTYFPSRDALLNEVASTIFSSFEAPAPGLVWREAMTAWLHELRRLLDRYPVGLYLIKLEGEVSPSWIGVLTPLVRVLANMGLSDHEIFVTSNWITRVSLSLLMARGALPEEGTSVRDFAAPLADMSDEDRALIVAVSMSDPGMDAADEIYDLGVRNIILGLEDMLRG
ncbi:TetR/AcrR family transcriptional regulator [Sphingomonas montanisoli]|nr:TetR/AcrR family transcriptional regulator [Sphingomonas montanisoli]